MIVILGFIRSNKSNGFIHSSIHLSVATSWVGHSEDHLASVRILLWKTEGQRGAVFTEASIDGVALCSRNILNHNLLRNVGSLLSTFVTPTSIT